MYHGAARDHGDKKRQRLTPPPNEVWMEAIMSKGKAPEGYVPVTSGPVVPATAAAAWQGRAPDREAPPPQYQQYSTYQGRTVERSTVYPPQGRVAESSTGYSAQGRMATGYAQARTVDAAGYQGPAGYQGRTTAGYHARTTGFQGRADMYQERVMQQRPTGSQQLPEASTGFKGKMAEDYKRERKLPPRVEEMLREQVNLDESVLHDAFAVAMEDLIPEQEANFVAKGLCHLCGAGESHYVPVVNFCPHADEGHSLCREHLRSVYRVRLEALFVGRNGSAPNRRLLRCLVCTSGCPCTSCTQVKVTEVQKYKRYLLDTLRRNGQGGTAVVKDNRAPPATPTGPDGRISFSGAPNVASSDSHRYAQYPPTPQGDGRAPVVRGEVSARGVEDGRSWEGHRQIPTQQSDYGQYPAGERDSYPPNMQAQQKPLPRYPPLPKRAAKDTPTDMLSVIADSVHAVDPRVAARIASPLVHQGSAESPTAATVLNCAESEKSLVHLLSTLNQDTEPSSMAMDLSASSQSSKDSTHRQVELRYGTNGIVARKESSGYAQDSGDQGSGDEMEASSRLTAERGIANRRRQADSPYQDQSSTSSMDSADESTSRDRSSAGARSAEEVHARKRKASESDAEDSPAPRNSNDIRNDSRLARRDESSISEHNDEEKNRYPPDARSKLASQLDGSVKANTAEAGSKGSRSAESSPAYGPARQRHPKESRSAESSPAYGPGRPRQLKNDTPSSVSVGPRAERKNLQERKSTPPPKRGRGRPPKNAKRVKRDEEETEDETYNQADEEDDEDDEDEGDDSDSELDTNLDFCEVCQGAGDLVCCDKCPRSFHLKCLHMKESDLPEGDWQCAECRKPSRFDLYSTAVASEQGLLDKCLKIVTCLKSHPFSKPFLTPVENIPMYTRVVKQPMDLSTIEDKLKKGAYIVDSNTVAAGVKELDSTHFANDIRLMWSNCKLFNDDGSGITRAADILSAGFERLYKESIEPPLTT
ncbi:E3 ubiquitin-protein ligase TRIM33 [Phytophthora ramorum]|uniref:E3 ubiquitin-protein ligase TRIM33 n=1 Tax=Phytophthora ramorum TaxID=164328 RepID=UPI0030A1FD4A|nr:E3 ubiquitin-protein ligase TRIM33 [Phytophthora ramorum]